MSDISEYFTDGAIDEMLQDLFWSDGPEFTQEEVDRMNEEVTANGSGKVSKTFCS